MYDSSIYGTLLFYVDSGVPSRGHRDCMIRSSYNKGAVAFY